MEKINKIKKAFNEGNLSYRLFTVFLSAIGYSNYHIAGLEIRNKVSRYVKKKYGKEIKKLIIPCKTNKNAKNGNDNVWICWLQGLDNAPNLVKCCVNSVYKYMSDKKIHIITKDNMYNYVTFPPHIIEKWEKGIISNTFFSDLLRTELLIRFGGLWIDSTVLLTSSIPNYVYKNSIFMYTINDSEDTTRIYNNFFIYSEKGNEFLITLRDIMYLYWQNENKVRDYFIWHIFAAQCAPYYNEILKDLPYIPNSIPHMLSQVIFEKFDENYWTEINKITPIHKLSNKFNVPENFSDTYYEKIISGTLL